MDVGERDGKSCPSLWEPGFGTAGSVGDFVGRGVPNKVVHGSELCACALNNLREEKEEFYDG
jgi:hypothetical protein